MAMVMMVMMAVVVIVASSYNDMMCIPSSYKAFDTIQKILNAPE